MRRSDYICAKYKLDCWPGSVESHREMNIRGSLASVVKHIYIYIYLYMRAGCSHRKNWSGTVVDFFTFLCHCPKKKSLSALKCAGINFLIKFFASKSITIAFKHCNDCSVQILFVIQGL